MITDYLYLAATIGLWGVGVVFATQAWGCSVLLPIGAVAILTTFALTWRD